MKKYFLKGKEFITKKLQQLDIETDSVDYVRQQIPNRLKLPLSVLMTQQIDLEPTYLYDTYFKNYPTHHLSQFLLQKINLQFSANSQPIKYLPPQNGIFIPKSNEQLEKKALLMKEVIEQYDEGYTQVQQTVICICVIHFHHKRGTQIQYSYPKTKTTTQIEDAIVHHAMPDSSHNKPQDYNFFNFQSEIEGKKRMLFGVSYFKQIKLTEEMKNKNKQLTRSYIQKAVAIVSALPLFGYLKFRLAVTTKLFFDNFTNFQIINAAYKDLSKHLNQTWPKMSINQLYIGSDLKVIIGLFGAQQFYQIWKAVLYQRRVVVFAHSSSSASSFILSLLSLFPGLNTFGIYSKSISRYMQSLRQYALPLRIFSSDNFMSMSFHIQDFHHLLKFQKQNEGHFLIGTTNRLLKQANDYGVQLLINLQNCTIDKKKSRIGWQSLNKKQKGFIDQLQQIIHRDNNLGYGSSQDCIRNHFHNFLKDRLVQIIQAITLFKNFINQCKQYQKNQKNNSNNQLKKQSSYQLMEQENQNSVRKSSNDDFPPLIPRQVTNIPFSLLLQQKSFTHFLQFHNKQLPNILNLTHQNNNLKIINFDYILDLSDHNFIKFNITQKKLYFGKGQPTNYQGKQIKYKEVNQHKENSIHQQENYIPQAKSIYIGIIINNKYCKNGFYIDQNQIYQGDFDNGVKHGYGKLTNSLHKYIGYFQNNLYSGDGQLVTGQNVYVGEFKEGLRHGCGKNQGPELSYDGQWQNDYPHGQGVLTEIIHNQQTQSLQNQKQKELIPKIQSQFNQTITHIDKIIINQQNKTTIQFIGNFKKGKLDQKSQVTIRYGNGNMYKGQVKDKKPNGRGFLVDSNGHLLNGIFKDGVFIEKQIQKKDKELKQQEKQQQIIKKLQNNQENLQNQENKDPIIKQ